MDTTHRLEILVPVLWRPDNAAKFVASLRATVDMTKVIVTAIPDIADRPTVEAWRNVGADVLCYAGQRGTFPRKINHAWNYLTGDTGRVFHGGPPCADWLLLIGDDVAFQAGWFESLFQLIADRPDVAVIGTDDLGFEHGGNSTVHPAISRTYIADHGAGFDGPGIVCHEGYDHHYVDAEIRAAAERRNVFAPCPGAVIVHLHHVFRRGPVDATYERGVEHLADDRALFDERYHAWVATLGTDGS